jgi:outer membrane protein assembly factor BamB
MANDPPIKGAAVWSSLAYDEVLNRVYVGTGNAEPDSQLPTKAYSNGLICLQADSGEFAGFVQPLPSDSYRPIDTDVDMAGSPTLYNNSAGLRVCGIGGKTGSYFVVRADDVTTVVARRQLIPYQNGQPLPNIPDPNNPNVGDADYGIFSAAGVDFGSGRLFVGMGSFGGFDPTSTPFVRALDWTTLEDAWPTQVVDGIVKYNVGNSPFYTAESKPAVSSPAVSNGVVLVTTFLPALYAFNAATGDCLWRDQTNIAGFPLGPAIYANFVVVTAGSSLFRWQVPPGQQPAIQAVEEPVLELLLGG